MNQPQQKNDFLLSSGNEGISQSDVQNLSENGLLDWEDDNLQSWEDNPKEYSIKISIFFKNSQKL